MFDLNRTIKIVTGALFNREPTWRNYLPEAGDWKKTALLLTVPLIIASAVISYLLSLVFADSGMFAVLRPTLLSTVVMIITGAIAAGVVAFIVSALAGVFGGKSSFALGLAAITLAFVPGYVGQALTWLPWIGGFLALGLAIFSLVQLWKIIPIYLEVPDGKRAVHYIVSLVLTIVAMLIIGRVVNPLIYGPDAASPFDSISSDDRSGGRIGDLQRRAALMAEAQEDTFTPPDDGKLNKAQVRTYVEKMQELAEANAAKMQQMQELAAKAEADEELSVKDLGTMMSGMTEIGGFSATAIEIVKRDGGNWAEHQWVQQTLLTAARQKDTNDAVAHNYKLYTEYAEELESFGR